MAEYISKEDVLEKLTGLFQLQAETAKAIIESIPTADVVPGSDLRDCRNELCLRCGDYKQRHLGACDGCRWRADNG